jgi:hypothetical protein
MQINLLAVYARLRSSDLYPRPETLARESSASIELSEHLTG